MVSLRGKHSVVKNNQNVSFHSNMNFQIPVACLQYFQAHNSSICVHFKKYFWRENSKSNLAGKIVNWDFL